MACLALRLQRWFATCLILHPVTYPNKGPIVEQYLAEEAVGLAKSLGWNVAPGPYWKHETRKITPVAIRDKNVMYIENDPDELQDGDYLRTSIGNGVLYVRKDGMIFDGEESESEGDLYKQWKDKLLRESLANSSLIRSRKVVRSTYFTKGKLSFLADFIRKHQVDCLYVNTELKPTQVKNLKKYIEARINDVSPMHAYKAMGLQEETETEFETEEQSELRQKRTQPGYRKIRIFDRFSIILQIFAQRSTTKLARLQIELSYLNYLRTRLARDGSTYSSNLNIFSGDLMNASEVSMEVISAKQRRAARIMSGQGESQLDIEKRNIRDKEAAIRRQIQEETRLRGIQQQKIKKRNMGVPVVALVGYTNVGKSALMNVLMKKEEVKSKDLLFQTLQTTSRNIILPSGTRITLLDTIGFITKLPVEMVQAFKSTLEQIAHADLVLHLRDISHPQHNLQQQSVIKILEELKFDKSFYNQRMLQVWNKVDLVHEEQFEPNTGGLKISCVTGEGMKELATLIEQKLHTLNDMKKYRLEVGLQDYDRVLAWLREHTNHTFNIETEYNYEPTVKYKQGSAVLSLDLDKVAIGKLQKFLDPEKPRAKAQRGLPPAEGW